MQNFQSWQKNAESVFRLKKKSNEKRVTYISFT